MFISSTKAHSDRVLVAPQAVLDVQRQHQTVQDTERVSTPDWEDHGLVFTNLLGRPLDP